MKATRCLYLDLPLTGYPEALRLQREITASRMENRLEDDVILCLEHPPVFTLGRNGGRENLVVPEDFLRRMDIAVVQIERGGNITYHGPGQLVAYPILDLNASGIGIRDYVGRLEEAMVRTAADWGVAAAGHPKNRGVWVGERKLGSIGVSVTRGICFHGLALNVNTDLAPFDWIHPCGFQNIRMTSLSTELGREVPLDRVRRGLKRHLAAVLNKAFTDADLPLLMTGLMKEREATAERS
ncbi:lipoyl(octanoyl) transferase LipB [Desulfococcus sp.]|uniref:lipoyl(octanoyl) transferase LipB n=1 Tax=Desulfococcus sp. TaxID=2025834 RepID=UPI0035944D42